MRARGLEVTCEWLTKDTYLTALPAGDVYHMWIWPRYYDELVNHVHGYAEANSRRVVLYADFCQSCQHEAHLYDIDDFLRMWSRRFGPERVKMIRIRLPPVERHQLVSPAALHPSVRGAARHYHYTIRLELGSGWGKVKTHEGSPRDEIRAWNSLRGK